MISKNSFNHDEYESSVQEWSSNILKIPKNYNEFPKTELNGSKTEK